MADSYVPPYLCTAPNYERPAFNPKLAEKLAKPSKRQAVVKKEARQEKKLTRAQVVAKVWLITKGVCQRCGKKCKPPKETYPLDPDRGEVNDILPVSRGGDRLDLDNQELICRGCHFGGPSGAHAPTKARMKKDRRT
jgi:5-methylcytosine-specific restriction endonuclease McrA